MLLYHSAPGELCVPPLLLLLLWLLLLLLPVGSLKPRACSPRTTFLPSPAPRLLLRGCSGSLLPWYRGVCRGGQDFRGSGCFIYSLRPHPASTGAIEVACHHLLTPA